MKFQFSFISLFLVLIFGCLPPLPGQEVSLAKVWKDGRYGFIDVYGREVIPEIYDNLKEFSEGMLPVNFGARQQEPRTGGLWGYCDTRGNIVVKMEYQEAGQFKEGKARVKLHGKWGFINRNGDRVIPLKYDDCGSFKGGIAPVKVGMKWGFINSGGYEFIQPQFDYAYGFSDNGLARVVVGPAGFTREGIPSGGSYGLINAQGSWVLEPVFDFIGPFLEGMAQVRIGDSIGFINRDGNLTVTPRYAAAFDFNGGRCRVIERTVEIEEFASYAERKKYESLVKVMGQKTRDAGNDPQALSRVFETPEAQQLSLIQANRQNFRDTYGFIDIRGKTVVPCVYQWADDFKNGFSKACITRQEPRPATYARGGFAENNGPAEQLLSETLQLKRYGIINRNGETVLPFIYHEVFQYEDNVLVVRDQAGGKVRAITMEGEELIPAWHEHLVYLGDGFFSFRNGQTTGVIHLSNIRHTLITSQEVIEVSYLGKQRFRVKTRRGTQGIMDIYGNWILRPDYAGISDFKSVQIR
ncbi:MAG: WG repeat-containing protein [Bacteroidota bacterium]